MIWPTGTPEALIKEHLWVTGGSGSGKTALTLAPLLEQLVTRKDVSIVFIDQKDDAPSNGKTVD